MFEKFLSTNSRDFRQRYVGTYGFYCNKGKKTLVKLADVNLERGELYFLGREQQTFTLKQDHSDDIGFEFLPPKAAWHNTMLGALLVRRVAHTQYSRGICSNNTVICNVNLQSLPVEFAQLSAIYEHSVTPAEAEKEGRSFAVSPQFAVDTKRNYLFLFDKTIGGVFKDDTGYTVDLTDKEMFAQEVQDAFKRASIGVTVK